LISVATAVGLLSGLLANAGGFLLVPSYTEFLKQPMKKAFACSLAVSSVLAIVHAYLGHISWAVTGMVALGSVPFSYVGARLAIRTRAVKLDRWYGLALTALGTFFLLQM
jgi:uncharacterized membrane protein YfcA